MTEKAFLTGKTIKNIRVADDCKAVLFICDDGDHIAKTDGDCCSNSWVQDITLPDEFPFKVIAGEDIPMPNASSHSDFDDELIQCYGYKIKTDKGDIVIEYRNASNGYYGGDLSWPDDEYFYGGVFGQNVSTMKWADFNFS